VTPLTATAQPQPQATPHASGPALLAELTAAHAALLERIAELGAITGQAAAPRLEYSAARMRLSQASIDRRTVLNRTLRHLSEQADDATALVLARVREADGELIAHSVKHLATWTAESISADWRGYCEASREMRDHMARTVHAEAELLKPLLAR
jgi:hypothetical protein